MQPRVFADKIFYYEEALSDPAKLVNLIESLDSTLTGEDAITPWQDWVASGDGDRYVFGHHKHIDRSKLPTSTPEVQEVCAQLYDLLTAAGKDYAEKHSIEYLEPSPISIARYIKGASMGPHVDWYGDLNLEPIMSAVVYLNDNMIGGELNFPVQGVKIKPKAGSIIVFPSVEPFFHESLLIVEGVKYMAPIFWIKDKKL